MDVVKRFDLIKGEITAGTRTLLSVLLLVLCPLSAGTLFPPSPATSRDRPSTNPKE